MSVLYDVLNIAKEKQYMVLDPVSQDPPENKSAMHMVSKRKVNGPEKGNNTAYVCTYI